MTAHNSIFQQLTDARTSQERFVCAAASVTAEDNVRRAGIRKTEMVDMYTYWCRLFE